MTDTTNLSDQTERGRRASIVLEDIALAVADLEEQCFDVFKRSDLDDDAGRKNCRMYLRVLEDITDRFEFAVINGEISRKKLAEMSDEENND